MSNHGQKVTTTSESTSDLVYEGGIVTKDSLAGESIKSGGAYGIGNPKTAASDQPSYSTTTNTTDTSSAEVLPPTRSGGMRGDRSDHQTFDKGRVDPFTHNRHDRPAEDVVLRSEEESNVGRNAREAAEREAAEAEAEASSEGLLHPESNKEQRRHKDSHHHHPKPKAEKHEEVQGHSESSNHHHSHASSKEDKNGEFDGPNASFNQEIGGKNDPGRLGEDKLIGRNDEFAASAGRPRDQQLDGSGPFSELKEESA